VILFRNPEFPVLRPGAAIHVLRRFRHRSCGKYNKNAGEVARFTGGQD
jgi:hypothetical protein